jgi:gluconokinase
MVYDEALNQRFGVSELYHLTLAGDRAELDPRAVYDAVATCLRACVQHADKGAGLQFIAFSAALHSFIAVDDEAHPLTNCITWADMRGAEFNAELRRCCKGQIYAKTGCPGNAIYMPAKVLWLEKYRPDLYEAAAKYVSIKEYVLHQLTGEWVADYGVASGGGLLNLKTLQWDQQILQFLGISAAQLSSLADGPTIVRMSRSARRDFGVDIPLVLGSGDGQLANLGAGTYGTSQYVATIGSSGAIRAFAVNPILDRQQRTWCYRLDAQTCVVGGAINNGGLVLNWLVENCFQSVQAMAKEQQRSIYEILDDEVQAIPAGSNGLLFLPFLTGERSPDWNSKARGLIIGLGISHSRKELVKAAMEGVVLRLYSNFRVLEEHLGESDSIIVNGGFTQSPVWLQIMADIFNTNLDQYEHTVNSTLGAVFMGFKALGRLDNFDQVQAALPLIARIRPDGARVATYRDLYALYEAVYAQNRSIFNQMYAFRKSDDDQSTDYA